MDKFIVRFSILILNAYMMIVLIFALNGVDISEYDYIFTDSLMIGLVLTTLVHVQGKYHCKWIRFLCYNLMIVPLFNYFDCKYSIFKSAECYIYSICGILLFAVILTIILAINHFRKVRKLKKQQHEFRQRNKGQNR